MWLRASCFLLFFVLVDVLGVWVLGENRVRVYSSSGLRRVIAFIPPGHYHVRFILEFEDQVIVLQESSVAGLVRAFAGTVLHPSRRALELRVSRVGKRDRKPGYAEWQLLETGRSEEEVLREAVEIYSRGVLVEGEG